MLRGDRGRASARPTRRAAKRGCCVAQRGCGVAQRKGFSAQRGSRAGKSRGSRLSSRRAVRQVSQGDLDVVSPPTQLFRPLRIAPCVLARGAPLNRGLHHLELLAQQKPARGKPVFDGVRHVGLLRQNIFSETILYNTKKLRLGRPAADGGSLAVE